MFLINGRTTRALARLAPALGGLALAVALWLGIAAGTRADSNLNNLECRGHVQRGKPAPGDDDQQVKYVFACSGPITGYQIQPQIGDTGFDPAASVIDQKGIPVVTDSFTCGGDFPGWGVNCVGTYAGNWTNVTGTFAIATKLCDEPRVDPLLTVVTATKDPVTGALGQAISGPFDLGRPWGCKRDAFSGKTRIPAGGVATIGAPAPAKRAKPKHPAKKVKPKHVTRT